MSERGARFVPPPVGAVRLDGFWGERIDIVRTVTAPILRRRCEDAGMLEQIDVRQPPPAQRLAFQHGTVTAQMFWDSDLAKTIETAAYCLARAPDPALEASVDELVDMYERLQLEDGYIDSWYIRMQPGLRWTNLRDCHELYCAGHMIEAAVAYAQATGKRRLLDIMARAVAHIARTIGRGEGRKPGYPGHQEIELALVRMYRLTGDRSYLELARYFIDERGQDPKYFEREAEARAEPPGTWHHGTAEYNQWHKPVREQDKVVGHAVRAMYMYSGMADIAAETGDDALRLALERLWADLTGKRLYVTGGMGPSEENEGFTDDYDLPNENAYAETCASVGLVFWAQRMLGLSLDGRYGDVMELALYNNVLAGLSRDGARFFYDNPLESRGGHHRWTWHRCPCCPPNVARLVASLGSYFYGVGDGEIAVHLYGESEATLSAGGRSVKLRQRTGYPWDGTVSITLDATGPLDLLLRIPAWCRQAELHVNGEPVELPATGNGPATGSGPATGNGPATENGYLRLSRHWKPGDEVRLVLPMRAERLFADPRVRADAGCVALRHGPLVYCIEQADNGAGLHRLSLSQSEQIQARWDPDLLGGAVALHARARRATEEGWTGALYRDQPPLTQSASITAVPYFLWDNRAPGEMRVWLRTP